MPLLVIIILLFLLSLLSIFAAPHLTLWYVAIVVTEFPWAFVLTTFLLLGAVWTKQQYVLPATILGLAAAMLFSLPVVWAVQVSQRLSGEMDLAFGRSEASNEPFTPTKMITGIGQDQLSYEALLYDSSTKLRLDYYRSTKPGVRPCVIVVHGGSWKGGDSQQLPELNSHLAKLGYNIASINYRKAPDFKSPSQLEDLKTALSYLRSNAVSLKIDTNNIAILGRSAGAQIALLGAYTFQNMGIKAAISYYGPADMIWGYQNPANIYNSCTVLEDYIGDTYQKMPKQYALSSPMLAADTHAVPTLMIHGPNDVLVAYGHSTRLGKKLTQRKVPNYLLTLPWATHGCDYTLNGPSGQLATYAVERFLNRYLQ